MRYCFMNYLFIIANIIKIIKIVEIDDKKNSLALSRNRKRPKRIKHTHTDREYFSRK